jgi:hypothetical protein
MKKGFLGKVLRQEPTTFDEEVLASLDNTGREVRPRDYKSEALDIVKQIEAAGGLTSLEGHTVYQSVSHGSDFLKYPSEVIEQVEALAKSRLCRELNRG